MSSKLCASFSLMVLVFSGCGDDGGKGAKGAQPEGGAEQDAAGDGANGSNGMTGGEPDANGSGNGSSDAQVDTAECADGFIAKDGQCVADPCSGVACGDHGSCTETDGVVACVCSPGFDGESCSVCAEGYAGDACADCAEGFVAAEGDTCIADVCVGVACGDEGACVAKEGAAVCACNEGWTGAACDSCDTGYASKAGKCVLEPHTLLNLKVWQDASASSTLYYDSEGRVTQWQSRMANQTGVFFTAPAAAASRPSTVMEDGARRRIVFDGDDALAQTISLPNKDYTMYVVSRWASGEGVQYILGGTDVDAALGRGLALLTPVGTAKQVIFLHRYPFAKLGGDQVSSAGYDPTMGLQLVVAQRSGTGDGYLRQYRGLDFAATTPLTKTAFGADLKLTFGQNGMDGEGALKGELAEVLIYGGAHDDATRAKIETYLSVKWGLPGAQPAKF